MERVSEESKATGLPNVAQKEEKVMALGKQSGEFSYKVTSTTYSETSAQINLHGTATGFGTVEGTMTVTGERGSFPR